MEQLMGFGAALATAANPAVVGFDAGWKVELRKESNGEPSDQGVITLSRQSYFGQVKVDTTAAFRGGTFEVVVDGLPDETHNQIVGGPYVFVKIFLGWRDLGSGGTAPFGDLAAMLTGGTENGYLEVLYGRLTAFERVAGRFRYQTRLAGVDYRFHKLRCTAATQPAVHPGDPAGRYAELLCQQAGVPLVVHPRGRPGQAIDEVITIPEDSKVDGALRYVARRAHAGAPDRQIPMFLRTDGLHFGPWTAPVNLDPPQGTTKRLELRTGLVQATPVVDPNPDDFTANPLRPPSVLRFEVILRGRADIAVGDKVELDVDVPTPGELPATTSESVFGGLGDMVAGVAGMFGATPEPDYKPYRVIAVRHELDRSKGFVTTLKIERQDDDAATSATGKDAGTEPMQAERTRALDEAARTAVALAQARESRREVLNLDVGLVNAQWPAPGEDGGHELAAQRVDVQVGLDSDGAGNATVRAPRRETPTQVFNKPYLTLFAFGKAGLVVPHYPGTRVVDLQYREDVSQTIVAGCLWGEGSEPESEYGDWWLSLPTEVQTTDSIADARNATAPSGPASHDLIAMDGTRVLHVRGLRISVGEGKLPDVGTRPDAAPQDEVLIEHKSGAKVHIDVDGNITFEAASGKDMTFKANKITLDVQDSVEVT